MRVGRGFLLRETFRVPVQKTMLLCRGSLAMTALCCDRCPCQFAWSERGVVQANHPGGGQEGTQA